MKRTALKRTTGLKPSTTPLKRTSGIAPVSAKRKRDLVTYSRLRREYLGAHPRCQWPDCHRLAVEVHHSRGRVGSFYLDPMWFRGLCKQCHDLTHSDPTAAENAGVSFSRLGVIEL